MALTASIISRVSVTESGSTATAGGQIPVAVHSYDSSLDITSGTTAGHADLVWSRSARSVGASSNDDLDLAGVLTSVFGATITSARLVGVFIKNKNTTSGDYLLVGAAASNPCYAGLFADATDKITIGPGGSWEWKSPTDPGTVTAGSADVLRVANPGSNAVTFDIVLLLRSA